MSLNTNAFLETSRRHFGLSGLFRSLLLAGSISASLAAPALATEDAETPRREQRSDDAQPAEAARAKAVSIERMP